jgi:hypothetical protein
MTKAMNSNDINHDKITYYRTTGHALFDLMW